MASSKTGRFIFALKIEGIGSTSNATAADGCYRWCDGLRLFDGNAPAFDTDGLYRTGLLRWPEFGESSINPRSGESVIAGQTFGLRATDQAVAALWPDYPAVVAKLAATLNRSATSVDLDTSGLSGALHIGRECLLLGAESPSNTYAITRAQLLTSAGYHDVDRDAECFASPWPTGHAGRLVELVKVPRAATAYTDEVVIWRGILSGVATRRGGVELELRCDTALALVKQSRIYVDGVWRVPGGEHGGSWSTAQYGTPQGGRSVTGERRALVLFGGQYLLRKKWIKQSGATTAFWADPGDLALEAFDDSPLPDGGFEALKQLDAREVYASHLGAPSNVDSPGTDDLPLSSEPGPLILQLLLTTPDGGADADYDLGIRPLAGNVPPAVVDKAGILAWNDEVRHLARVDVYIGLDKPDGVELWPLIRSIAWAFGGVVVESDTGLISVVRVRDVADYGEANAITQSQVLSVEELTQDRGLEDVVGRVRYKSRQRPGRELDTVTVVDVYTESRTPPGLVDTFEIEAPWLRDTADIINMGLGWVQRWHRLPTMIALATHIDADFEPGDVVSLTHDKVLTLGGRGCNTLSALIVAKRPVWGDTPRIEYRAILTGEALDKTGLIAPAGEVSSASAIGGGVFDLTLAADTFVGTTGRGPFAADAAAFDPEVNGANAPAKLTDQYGTVRDSSLTITSRAGNVVRVAGCSVTPVAGDVLLVDDYADANATQQGLWAWIADANNELNGGDLPTQYAS